MPIYRQVGDSLLRKEEIIETISTQTEKSAEETSGIPMSVRGDEIHPFEDVGQYMPLLIEIRHVYTGEHPKNWLGPLSPNDMLVTSAVRSLATFNARPKAINFLKTDIKTSSNLRRRPRGESHCTPQPPPVRHSPTCPRS